ncbi:MAG TPA: type IV pilus twitching motility protein PilT [Pyrinomonadaceae bacterium]|nr:type IV pilus twitching motility protein PilT [Pyrinomonadaceae bacterium]
MEILNEYLQTLVTTASNELRLEPNKNPFVVSANGPTDIGIVPMQGTQISMMVFPLIPLAVKQELPGKSEVEFVHPHNLGKFNFSVQKSPAGFVVSIRPLGKSDNAKPEDASSASVAPNPEPAAVQAGSSPEPASVPVVRNSAYDVQTITINETSGTSAPKSSATTGKAPTSPQEFSFDLGGLEPAAEEYIPEAEQFEVIADAAEYEELPQIKVQESIRPNSTATPRERMDSLFSAMDRIGASDLHLSVSVPPMVRKDGKMQHLECGEPVLTPESMKELLFSIMPPKNREEFEIRNDTDFAYEIPGLARFRCNVFADRKGAGGVFRIIPTKILTAEQLGLSKAIMDLCSLSKGLVVVTGPTGSGKSTTLCAMVDSINKSREDHIITIEDPIEFVHDNQKCLVNQREVHNHTDSFKDALRAALREDPDILLVGEMRDLETISIAIETAETGHLVFGTLHTTTAASTVDRIIDQFPADRQQQIRVMLSESLRGVIAQTLLPKIGGGRVAALEILIITPAISNLIREGKTFQIPSAMQTGKTHGMVMLNEALFDLVKSGQVEARDAWIKAIDKPSFETMLTRGGLHL